MKRLTTVISGLLLAGTLGACTVHGTARGGYYGPSAGVIVVEEAPPPPPRRQIVYRPGYLWIEGRYHYNNGRYVWHDGRYERERSGYRYNPGRWQRQGRGHVWVEGRWDADGGTRDRRTDRRRVRDHR